MKMYFTKMHGLGNDFVVIDAINQEIHLTAEQISALANRHTGIGFDQLLLVAKPNKPDIDFFYRIFNADGSEVAQCGNGARAIARFVVAQGLTNKKNIQIATLNNQLTLILEEDGTVSVSMGMPKFAPQDIPITSTQVQPQYTLKRNDISVIFSALSLGNPHAVLEVADVAVAPVAEIGTWLSQQSFFPQSVNVGFMQIINQNNIRLRVFERGAGETLACGSGACAAAVVAIKKGLCLSPVKVQLPGGVLTVEWAGGAQPVWLRGPAETVYVGNINL